MFGPGQYMILKTNKQTTQKTSEDNEKDLNIAQPLDMMKNC